MSKSLKSIGVSLSVLFAVTLLILGAEAFRDSVDSKTQAVVEASNNPAYSYGQIVKLDLPQFYKTCNDTGIIVDFSHGIYDVSVLCETSLLVNPLRTFKLKESSILGVVEETNQ